MKLSFFLILLSASLSFAQGGGGRPTDQPKGEIYGNVIDSLTGAPISYVTVMASKQSDGSFVKGVVTDDAGKFSLDGLAYGTYKVKISFVGYNVQYFENVSISDDDLIKEFKDLELGPTVLNTVEVIGGTPDITYEIDKKVINVEDQINTAGQSAIEILQNIPSVTVSADGTVSLRGSSSFTLLIDGIPTAMDPSDALAVIPASTIKDIEIITNPSARFDAEGTSGVINIITKKSKLEGISCLVNLNGGTFNNYGGDVAVNVKKEKFSFDVSANINRRSGPRNSYVERVTEYDSVTNTLISDGESNWQRRNIGAGLEFQYTPNKSHVLVLKSNFNTTLMDPYSDYQYTNYDDGELIDEFTTNQHNYIDILGSTSNLYYQYNFNHNPEHRLSFKAIANLRDVTQFDTTLSYDEDGNITSGNLYTETGPSNSYRFNIDYSLPLKNDKKFETGIQSQFGKSGDIGKNYTYNTSTGEYDFNALFSSDVDYVRDIHAAYSMFSGKHKSLGYQIGLRAEYTYRTISSTNFADFATINRLDFFPSAHFSYSFENKSQVLASYSRRIERPRSYFFEPFITWESPFNVRTGNPNLVPEYINVAEISYVYPLQKKGFISVDAYYRQNQNTINRVSSVYEEGILISQPYNIGTSQSIGIEPTLIYSLTDWWKINNSYNIYYFNLEGSINDVDYGRESFNYSGRLTNTFEFTGGWMLQFVSSYRSGSVTAQGEDKGRFRQDASLRKSFAKNRYALTLQGRNIFGTDNDREWSYTENVTIYSERSPLVPRLTLSFSMRLNNYQKVYERGEGMDDF